MKKIQFLISLFTFSFLLCKAQDTLVYENGEKVVVKVISIGNKIDITDSSGRIYKIHKEFVSHICFADGSKRWLNEQDTINQFKVKNSMADKLDDKFNHMPIIIDVVTGASLISWEIGDGPPINEGPEIISETPVFNITVEYSFIKLMSIGISGAFQQVNDVPSFDGTLITSEAEQITRYNIDGFCLFHIINKPYNDLFAGFKIGGSIWNDQITRNKTGGPSWGTVFPSNARTGSFQVFLGYRGYVNYNFGFNIEVGIGSPYLIEGGLTFRIKTRKDKK